MKTNTSPRSAAPSLEAGQIWLMEDAKLEVVLVGNILVHYKLGKADAVRVPNSVAAKTTIEKYLKRRKAVVSRAKRKR
jgi:hypothetical protein